MDGSFENTLLSSGLECDLEWLNLSFRDTSSFVGVGSTTDRLDLSSGDALFFVGVVTSVERLNFSERLLLAASAIAVTHLRWGLQG